jgi:hypothetical protein
MQNVAGNHLRCHEEQEGHRREVKRLGQDSLSLHDATSAQNTWPQRRLSNRSHEKIAICLFGTSRLLFGVHKTS